MSAALLAALLAVPLASAPTAGAASIAQAEQSLLDAINRAREIHHLRPLRRDGRLDDAARDHSDDMARHGYFAHTSLLSLVRLPGRVIGENLAWSRRRIRARLIVAEWLSSPPHRANLLRAGFRRVGVGVAVGRVEGAPKTRVITVEFSGK
jgi:uncharacterized protein YkwD